MVPNPETSPPERARFRGGRISRLLLPIAIAAVLASGMAGAAAASFSRVVIDPGHGGHDRGGFRSYYFEKHLALDVAFRLEKYLKDRGLRTVLSRRRDEFIPLDDRAKLSNRTKDSVFVSIHFNSASRTSASGIETFYYNSRSYALASSVQTALIRGTRATNRGVKNARFRVLRLNERPAILVECGFLSNSTERRKCLDPKYRQRLAESIGAGIVNYRRGS